MASVDPVLVAVVVLSGCLDGSLVKCYGITCSDEFVVHVVCSIAYQYGGPSTMVDVTQLERHV